MQFALKSTICPRYILVKGLSDITRGCKAADEFSDLYPPHTAETVVRFYKRPIRNRPLYKKVSVKTLASPLTLLRYII